MRKAAAGILVGLCAAAIVLALTNIDAFRTVELKTYDWRLTRTANPSTARKDIALVEIDEYSLRNLQPHAGRWPWPRVVHASLIDYLSRGKPALIAYDVLFADADLRVGFPYGGETWSGKESDDALSGAVRKAGNVILLADATFTGETTTDDAWLDQGYRIDHPQVFERKVILSPTATLAGAAAALGHNLFSYDPDGPLRHTIPFVRVGNRAMPSLGLSAAMRVAGAKDASLATDGSVLTVGGTAVPIETRDMKTEDGNRSFLWALINFRGPAFDADLKTRPYPLYPFFDLLYSEEQLLAGEKPNIDP